MIKSPRRFDQLPWNLAWVHILPIWTVQLLKLRMLISPQWQMVATLKPIKFRISAMVWSPGNLARWHILPYELYYMLAHTLHLVFYLIKRKKYKTKLASVSANCKSSHYSQLSNIKICQARFYIYFFLDCLYGLLPGPFLLSYSFLGQILRVDLIKLVSNVRPSIRPQNVSSISMKFGT